MSTEAVPKGRKFRYWPLVFVAAVGAAIYVSGIHEDVGPGGIHLIHSGDEYQRVLKEATDLSTKTLADYRYVLADHAPAPAGQDLADLQKSAVLFDELNLFAPEKMANYFALGRIRLLLGQPQIAEDKFLQAIENAVHESNPQSFRSVEYLTAQARFFLAQCYEMDGKWPDALDQVNQAMALPPEVKAAPESATKIPDPDVTNYLYVRARAEIQLGQVKEAVTDLKKSVALSAGNTASAGLLKFAEKSAGP